MPQASTALKIRKNIQFMMEASLFASLKAKINFCFGIFSNQSQEISFHCIIFPFLEHCCSNMPVIDLYYMTMLAIIYDVVASGYCCLLQLQVMMPSGNWKLTHFRKIGLITGFNTSWSSFIKKKFTQYFVIFIDFSKFRSAISLWRIMEKKVRMNSHWRSPANNLMK